MKKLKVNLKTLFNNLYLHLYLVTLLLMFLSSNINLFAQNNKEKPPPAPFSFPNDGKSDGWTKTDTIYQDEDGKVISESEFIQKVQSSNYTSKASRDKDNKNIVTLLKTEIGISAKNFAGTFLNGSNFALSQFKGKVIVLNFWFIGCSPCYKEMPELNLVVKKYAKNKDVLFISITPDKKLAVAKLLLKRKFAYKHIIDAQNIIDLYNITSFPTHIVIDRSGNIQFNQGYSPNLKERLAESIDSALQQNY